MALSGVHLTFGYAKNGGGVHQREIGGTLPYKATSSQTMASPTTSSISAPTSSDASQPVIASLSASTAIFYVVGPAPDITNGPRRYYDPALNAREDIYVDAGDKVAWTTA